jgi:hypothetical protein
MAYSQVLGHTINTLYKNKFLERLAETLHTLLSREGLEDDEKHRVKHGSA